VAASSVVRSSQFRPLPRQPGVRQFQATSGPFKGKIVSEWFVRNLRSKESGFKGEAARRRIVETPQYREARQKDVAEQGGSLARKREFDRLYAMAFEGARTWSEAEQRNADWFGQLLLHMGEISPAVYYQYFRGRTTRLERTR